MKGKLSMKEGGGDNSTGQLPADLLRGISKNGDEEKISFPHYYSRGRNRREGGKGG